MISPKQPFGLLLQRQDVGADLLQGAHGLGLVEVAGEADLVADLDAVGLVPGVGGVGQHLAPQEGLDAALFQERDLLGVAQVGVGLVLDHGGFAVDVVSNRPRSGSGSVPFLWIFLMTGGASSARVRRLLELLDLLAACRRGSGRCPSMRSGRSTVTFQ